MAEQRINGAMRIMDGTTNLRTLKELNALATTLNTNLTNLTTTVNTLNTNLAKILPKSLYANSSGTTGNITLSDTIANYTYIEIAGYVNSSANTNYKTAFCQRFRQVGNGYQYNLFAPLYNGSTYLYTAAQVITLNAKALTRGNIGYYNAEPGKGDCNFYIRAVNGYKY